MPEPADQRHPPTASQRREPCPNARSDCPSEQQIVDLVAGRIEPHEAERIASILDECTVCERYATECESRVARQWQAFDHTFDHHPALSDTIDHEVAATRESASGAIEPPRKSADAMIGRYRVVRELGRGGMGVVYEAEHVEINRRVAIKVMRGLAPDEQQKRRFQAETHAAAKLEHPNIVRVYELGESEGDPYFVMQLVEGETLSASLARRPLTSKLAANYVRELAEAMHYAHQRQVIHRDIKPSNVLIANDGQLYITDFGLAKIVGNESELTSTGQALGTPSYMPPEQALGNKAETDHRADVYSLGAVLYACLTGRPPHQAATAMATIVQVRDAEIVSPRRLTPDIPRDLETICLKAVERQPDARYPSAQALAEDLARFLAGEPILARPAPAWEKAWKWARRRPLVAALIAFVVFSLIAASVAVNSAFYNERLAASLKTTEEALHAEEVANVRAEEAEYLSQLAIAQLAWEQNDVPTMQAALEKAPERLRGWEHGYLSGLPDGMLATIDQQQLIATIIDDPREEVFYCLLQNDYSKIEAYEKDTMKHVRTIETPQRRNRYARLTNDGQQLVSSLGNSRLVFYDAVTGKHERELQLKTPIQDFRMGRDDKTMAVIAIPEQPWLPRRAEVWDVETNEKLASRDFEGLTNVIDSDPRGEWFLIGIGDAKAQQYSIALIDPATCEAIKKTEIGSSPAARVCIAPSGDTIAVATHAHRILLIDRDSFAIKNEFRTRGLPANMRFSPDGSRLAVSSRIAQQWIAVYDLPSLDEVLIRGHADTPTGLAFNQAGTKLLTCAHDGKIHQWSITSDPSRRVLRGLTQPVWGLAFSPNGKLVAASQMAKGNEHGCVAVWDRASRKLVRRIVGSQEYKADESTSNIYWLAFGDDSDTILTLSWDNVLRYWSVGSGELIKAINCDAESGVHHAAMSPDRRWLVSGSGQEIFLWDLEAGLANKVDVGLEGTCMDIAFTNNSSRFLIGGGSKGPNARSLGFVTSVEHREGEVIRHEVYPFHENWIEILLMLPGQERVIVGIANGHVQLHDVASMELLWTSDVHRGPVQELAVHPGGDRIATTGTEQSCSILDASGGERLLHLQTYASMNCQVEFSPDGHDLGLSVNNEVWLLQSR